MFHSGYSRYPYEPSLYRHLTRQKRFAALSHTSIYRWIDPYLRLMHCANPNPESTRHFQKWVYTNKRVLQLFHTSRQSSQSCSIAWRQELTENLRLIWNFRGKPARLPPSTSSPFPLQHTRHHSSCRYSRPLTAVFRRHREKSAVSSTTS